MHLKLMAREGNKLEQTKFGKITFSLQYINFSNIWSRFRKYSKFFGKVCSSNCLNLIFALTIQWELMKKTSAWFAMNQMPLVLWAQFHQRYTYCFYACRSQKRKKTVKLAVSFGAFGTYKCKSCT